MIPRATFVTSGFFPEVMWHTAGIAPLKSPPTTLLPVARHSLAIQIPIKPRSLYHPTMFPFPHAIVMLKKKLALHCEGCIAYTTA